MQQTSPAQGSDPANSPDARDNGEPVSKQAPHAQFNVLREWVEADLDHSATWRKGAHSDFAFVAGPGQWSTEDRAALAENNRPVVTFNRTLKFVRAVNGLEVNNRQEATFIPTDPAEEGPVKANEFLSGFSEWMSRTSGSARKQSRVFRDCFICGMGFGESLIEYDDDPRGMYVENRIPPLEMFWDKNAREQNLSDRRRIGRVKKYTLAEARERFPNVDVSDLNAAWASQIETGLKGGVKTQLEKEARLGGVSENHDPKSEVYIVQIQWWEHELYRKVADPANPDPNAEPADVPEDQWQQIALQAKNEGLELPPHTEKPLRRKRYWQAFLGNRILEVGEAPQDNGFTLHAMTYEPDDTAGTWFGAVRVLRDPQQWSNKFFSQLMHIVNSTAKGGILSEEGAFSDIGEARRTYAKADAITETAKGAISGGKIMAKPGAGLTNGVLPLLKISQDSFADTLGVNLEFMGLADRQQAGILEAQRKQSALTIMATLFDSLSMYRGENAKTRLHFIQNYLTDDMPRVIAIAGKDGQMVAKAIRRDQTLGRYEVDVADAPQSPHSKERVWAALQPLLIALKDMLTPEVVTLLLDYVPGIPAKLTDALKQIAQRPNPDAPMIEHQKAIELETTTEQLKKLRAETEKTEAGADQARASAQAQRAGALIQLATAVGNMVPELMAAGQNNLGHELAEADADSQLMDPTQIMGPQQLPGPAAQMPLPGGPMEMGSVPELGELSAEAPFGMPAPGITPGPGPAMPGGAPGVPGGAPV